MVSDTVLGAAIGLSGAVIGSLLTGAFNWLSTRQRVEAEKERQHAEFYIDKKVEALTQLFAELEECHRLLIDKADPAAIPTSKEDFERELKPKPDDFEKSIRKAELFLNESQQVAMLQMWEEMNHALRAIERNKLWDVEKSDTHMSEWEGKEEGYIYFDLNEAYENAREVLKEEMNQPIRKFES